MSKFKVGDKVMLINVDRYTYYVDNIPNKLLGKPLVINSISTDKSGNEIVYAGVPEGVCCWQWYSDDLRLVSETQPEPATEPTDPAPAQKLLHRGDLVMYRGQIVVVHEIDPDRDDGCWVALLTGDGGRVCRDAEDLTRIGSIRKKIKRIKKEMEGGK